MAILSKLPKDFPLPIAVVQHCASDHRSYLPDMIRWQGAFQSKHAEEGETLCPANVYVAPPGRHLLVTAKGQATFCDGPKVCFARPSIDRLFESAAGSYSTRVLAIVLSGANVDGASGSRSIKRLGGVVIAQKNAAAPRMPAAAFATGCVDHMLPLETIPHAVTALCMMPGAAAWMSVFRHRPR